MQPVLCSKKLIQLCHVSASLVLVERIKLFVTFSVLIDCIELGRYTQHREISTPGNKGGKQMLGFCPTLNCHYTATRPNQQLYLEFIYLF